MKKVSIILLALIVTVLFANISMAAEDKSFTVNPFGLLVGSFNGTYEKSLGNQGSFLVSGSFLSWNISGDNITGIGVGGGYRKYLGDEEFSGFFVQGNGDVAFVKAPEESITAFGVGGLGGFKWIYNNGFTLELGAGGYMMFGTLEGYSFGGFSPSLALSLGYTW